MTSSQRLFLIFGALFGGIAVVTGALGAHALKPRLTEVHLAAYETAVKYQVYHALALILLVVIMYHIKSNLLKYAGYLFIAGIFIFSGSIYLLSTTEVTQLNVKFLGPVTPLGGLCLIAGWVCFLICAIKSPTLNLKND